MTPVFTLFMPVMILNAGADLMANLKISIFFKTFIRWSDYTKKLCVL